MSAEKNGTQYVREMSATFREIAEKSPFETIKDRLLALAQEMEPLATKLYFKTQKGTEDMEALTEKFAEVPNQLAACQDTAAAEALCQPFYDKLEQIIKHVKTMKVRMT